MILIRMIYSTFCTVYEDISKTSKRLEKVEILAEFLKDIPNPKFTYLLAGTVFPDFDQKDLTLEYLDLWSSDKKLDIGGVSYKAKDRNKIIYTDNLSVIIKMIQDMIEVITIALIVFTALSLVVSSVMIAIITYVSVIEREKEIGVIRALGGRKRDVSNLFNVETFIIGLISGIFGIVITYLITVIVNVSLRDLIEADHIAVLTLKTIGSMIALSIILTLISGSIPARMAAKKDPAEALRTE